LDVVADEWNEVKKECESIGRDPNELELSLRVFLDPNEKMEPYKSVGGSESQMIETIGQIQEIGASHILLDPVASGGIQGRLEALQNFMTNVAPQVQ
jgi:hypothetical protein